MRARGALILALMLAGCGTQPGDLGRARPTVLNTPLFEGNAAAPAMRDDEGTITGAIPFIDTTAEEKELRRQAFNVLTPIYDRDFAQKILLALPPSTTLELPEEPQLPVESYWQGLSGHRFSSSEARWQKLIEDIRADIDRLGPFFSSAQRVVAQDRVRAASLSYVSGPTPAEVEAVNARNGTNNALIRKVQGAMRWRVANYRYAMERLIMAAPSHQGVTAERAVAEYERRIREIPLLPPAGTVELRTAGDRWYPRAQKAPLVTKD